MPIMRSLLMVVDMEGVWSGDVGAAGVCRQLRTFKLSAISVRDLEGPFTNAQSSSYTQFLGSGSFSSYLKEIYSIRPYNTPW